MERTPLRAEELLDIDAVAGEMSSSVESSSSSKRQLIFILS